MPDNSTLSAHYTCEHFVNFSNNNQKLITVNPNGNSVDLDNVNISITSAFVQSLPNDVSTSNNGGGYYEINDGADLIRVSKRMTSIYAPGNYPVNGGVLVRVYFSPNDLSNIQSDPVANGLNELSHVGWFKASEHNPQNIINGISPVHPFMNPSIELTPYSTGVENGVDYVEFLLESFSTIGFFAKSSSTPLPVTLTNFSANCANDKIQVNWTTASELNASHYILQSSRDGLIWIEEVQVAAAGTTNLSSTYSAQVQNFGSLTYYRLLQIDLNGDQEIFGPISSNCSMENNLMSIYPNPTSENFTVYIQTSENFENATIELVDMSGRVILSQTTNHSAGSAMLNFDGKELLAGTYMIRVKGLNDKFTPIRVVKM